MVVTTSGYEIQMTPLRSEPAEIVDGNQIRIEHRFFLPSRPDPADWSDLTIEQAAADHHRIIVALKPIYTGRWLTTGGSKGGAAAVYHRRFYPDDVDGTIAYVAANDVNDREDHYAAFMAQLGTPECRQRVRDLQREALIRRPEIVPMMHALASANGYTYSILGSAERALDLHVVDWSIGFWLHGGQAFCPLIPTSDAPTAFIFAALDAVLGFQFYSDQGIEPLIPAAYQAGTQMGYPAPPEDYLSDLLLYPGEDVPRSFVPAEIDMPRFDRSAMRHIDVWVRTRGSELMFVYGEDDPVTAEPFRLGSHTHDSYWYLVPGTNHIAARIAGLAPTQQAEAIAVIRRWAGLTPVGD
jgi:hypothetical protein